MAKLETGADYSLTGEDNVFVNNDADFAIEGIRGKGALLNSSPGSVVAAWDCAASSLSGRGIIVEILYDRNNGALEILVKTQSIRSHWFVLGLVVKRAFRAILVRHLLLR